MENSEKIYQSILSQLSLVPVDYLQEVEAFFTKTHTRYRAQATKPHTDFGVGRELGRNARKRLPGIPRRGKANGQRTLQPGSRLMRQVIVDTTTTGYSIAPMAN